MRDSIVLLLFAFILVSCTCNTRYQSEHKQDIAIRSFTPDSLQAETDTISLVLKEHSESITMSEHQTTVQEPYIHRGNNEHKTTVSDTLAGLSRVNSQEDIDLPKQDVFTRSSLSSKKQENTAVEIKTCFVAGRDPVKIVRPSYVEGAHGEVHVSIKIDRQGNVVFAEVDPRKSSINVDLKQNARSAALASQFSSDSQAPLRQSGEIVYLF